MILRQASSGPVTVATVDGQVLMWDAATQQWIPGTLPAGGGPPLSLAYYVDQGTTVPVEDQTGACSAPFATCTAALAAMNAAHPGINGAVLLVVAGNYSSEDALVCGDVSIHGLTGGAGSAPVALPPCDFTGPLDSPPHIVLSNVLIGAGVTGNGSVNAFACDLGSFAILGGLVAESCTLSGTFEGASLVCRDSSCGFSTIAIGGNTRVEFYDTFLRGLSALTFGSPGGTIQLDAFSGAQWHALGAGISLGQSFVVADTSSAQVTVAVPALAAAALGYADVTVVGTELEGLGVKDIVVVNPTGDLHAAGAAGGFYVGARVSAPNTVRLAFVGTLTGGNATFNVARVSAVP